MCRLLKINLLKIFMIRKYDMKNDIWLRFMKIGAWLGCHQMPDRSFFIKNKQFPLCARCTGVIIGYIFVFASASFYLLPIWICFDFGLIMFLDWLVQFMGIKESSNFRRLITGIIGGIGVMSLEIYVLLEILQFISEKIIRDVFL